jgi:type VI secretion system secreted protein VgrG
MSTTTARQFELTTPLGGDALLFRAMRGHEELGRLSRFELSALSARGDIAPGDLLGKSVTVTIELRAGGRRYSERHLHGYVTHFAQAGMVGRYYEYRLTVRPWLWFLTRTADCRIFQDKTVPEIVKAVFGDHPAVASFEDGLTGTYAKREYCVQYRESDFAFVSRLLEEEGIYYYFEHGKGQHVMKLVDSYSGHRRLAPGWEISYYASGEKVRADEEFIHAWTFGVGIQPGFVALDDYDFTKPKADLAARAKLVQAHERADYEWFDAPGEYLDPGMGEQYARARIDEFHARYEQAEAVCNVRALEVGRLFTLTNAPRRDQEREYLVVRAESELRDNAYESAATDEAATYRCTFTALQSQQQFRPARTTRRPTVKGLHSAVVVGPANEEIWCDRYGRVKVQFHWDRYGKKNENSSCWIRVSHPWAGANWGMVALPRIGQEVVVDFLEGDPDQPLIVGRVYNADQMPPYDLPANKTQTGIKSRSALKGGPANFNEIRFEDKKDAEQLYIHAERNQDIEVEKDETHTVGNDRTKTIGHDEKTEIGHNRTEHVVADEFITVGGNRTRGVDGNEVVGVKLTRTHGVGINELITVGGAQEILVGGLRTVTVGGAQIVAVGLHMTETVGRSLSISAGTEITLQTGASSIVMRKDGTITIEGKEITIAASEKIKVSAQRELEMDGGKFSLAAGSGDGSVTAASTLDVKGALVKINC